MTSVLRDAMTRIAAMEIQALADLSPSVTAEAKPFFPWEQDAFPYLANWWQGPDKEDSLDDIDTDLSEDVVAEWHTIVARLVGAHMTAGYTGENQDNLYDWHEAITEYFRTHPFLTSDAHPTELDYIGPTGIQIAASTGIRTFANTGTATQQIGTEITLRLPIMKKVY